jgi:ribosomal-protein-alanine N-acetyltransferase
MANEFPAGFAESCRASAIFWQEGPPDLTTDRLTLREPRPGDGASLVEALANDDVARFMSPPPDTPGGFERFITWVRAERRAGRCCCYALVPHGGDAPVGLIQFRAIEPGFSTAEWGFALRPSRWGTGLFMDAARVAVDFAFRRVGVHRLEARASVVNGRGNGVLRKIGAIPEGVLRESLVQPAGRVDQVLWALLEEDWLREGGAPPYEERRQAPAPFSAEPEAPRPRPARPAWCEGIPLLTSDECTVREVAVDDVADLTTTLGDPEVQRYSSPPPPTRDAFGYFVRWSHEQRRLGRYACFVILPPSEACAVGLVQVRALDPSFQTAEWGFALGRAYWGTGLFRAAAGLVLDYAFGTMGVHRLEARTVTANQAAIRTLRRLGAVFEGTLRRSFLLGEQYHDDALCALLAADWMALRRRARREVA